MRETVDLNVPATSNALKRHIKALLEKRGAQVAAIDHVYSAGDPGSVHQQTTVLWRTSRGKAKTSLLSCMVKDEDEKTWTVKHHVQTTDGWRAD